ncbi:hypothetical protein ACIQU6_43025 [Streptomyces sp. NPDC090442]|uniref:hypothetical protein n=1 Tax=Streptomyces sp. NPDC090442 TaxID=3365962 RepID=UPI0037F33E07
MPDRAVRILTHEEYKTVYRAASTAAPALPLNDVHGVLGAALAALDIAPPPPEIEPDQCPALHLPTDPDAGPGIYLDWQQCEYDPGHDPQDGHESGECSWPASATYRATS